MILILNVCREKLSENEFVKPIEEILKNNGVNCFTKHYLELYEDDLNNADQIIICGTALQDFKYLEEINKFMWIKECKKPILGICAGMQIIGQVYGCEVIDKESIGQQEVKTAMQNELVNEDSFYSYYLNNKSINLNQNFEVLARGKEVLGVVKHKSKKVYGCLFHPEVMNSEIVLNFSKNL